MIRIFILAALAGNLLVACTSTAPYQPLSHPEKIEFSDDHLDIYPDDVRRDLNAYTNTAVVWAGIIRKTDALEDDNGQKISANTILEQHYFDWVQDKDGRKIKLSVSPRGEGLFSIHWHMDRTTLDSSAGRAEKYAGRDKLAIVYGVPEKVEDNGTIVLKYRYLRIIGSTHYNTNEFDYGRLGEPIHLLQPLNRTNAVPVK